MELKSIEVYDVNELPQAIRDRVVERHREINVDYEWYDWLVDDFKKELEDVGVEIKSVSWSIDRDRHCFMISPNVWDIRLFLRKLGLDKHELLLKFDDCSIYDISLTGRNESNFAEVDIEYSDEVECSEVKMSEIHELTNEMEDCINHWLDDRTSEFLKKIEQQYDYNISDEAIIDTLNANDYKFTKEGNQI